MNSESLDTNYGHYMDNLNLTHKVIRMIREKNFFPDVEKKELKNAICDTLFLEGFSSFENSLEYFYFKKGEDFDILMKYDDLPIFFSGRFVKLKVSIKKPRETFVPNTFSSNLERELQIYFMENKKRG